MRPTRRTFLASALATGAGAATARARPDTPRAVSVAELDAVLARPVLDLTAVESPVTIASMELLKRDSVYFVRVRSADGLEVVSVPNPAKMALVYPLLRNIFPVFLKRDARDLERVLWDVYRHTSNYKMQGVSLWVCVAAAEMAVLELLAHAAKVPLSAFFGGRRRDAIPVYFASSNRGNAPEAEIDHLKKLVADSGVTALKFRLGGRMSRNADSPPDRTERLIPLARKAFGDSFTLYGDANSSYDAANGVRIGRLLEESGYGFYEEPCEFDDLWGTKEVADALAIPVAGGEQEFSLHRWKWMIANRAVDIVQPDLHYGGGLVRATQVARMAEAAGMPVVPHMSGGGLGYLQVVQFAAFTPNIGPFMEYKGDVRFPATSGSSSLKCVNGQVECPRDTGFGVTIDPDYLKGATRVVLG